MISPSATGGSIRALPVKHVGPPGGCNARLGRPLDSTFATCYPVTG
jgi:hypothetical protein